MELGVSVSNNIPCFMWLFILQQVIIFYFVFAEYPIQIRTKVPYDRSTWCVKPQPASAEIDIQFCCAALLVKLGTAVQIF